MPYTPPAAPLVPPPSPHPVGHGSEAPSSWVQRWAHLVAPKGSVLDVACGLGRHVRWFAQRQHPVTGVDSSPQARMALAAMAANSPTPITTVFADIENDPWPLPRRWFDAVVVTNYLWRPLLPTLIASLAPGGVLIYETFAAGNETVGKPSRPDFLLQPGELLTACASLRIVAYEDGFIDQPPRFVQRIAAVRPLSGTEPPRHRLG